MATRLYYVGDRAAVRHYEPGVPGRDLDDRDLDALATAWTDGSRDGQSWTAERVRDYLASTVAYQKSKPHEPDEEPEPVPVARRAARAARAPKRRTAPAPAVRAPEPPAEVQAPTAPVPEVRMPWETADAVEPAPAPEVRHE